MKVICIIPARGGSKRLSRKNITPVLGKPMISYALSAAFDSRYIGKNVTYVSTEDTEIAEISASLGATVVDRPASLAEDTVWTQEVVEHAVKVIEEKTGDYFDIIVGAFRRIVDCSGANVIRIYTVLEYLQWFFWEAGRLPLYRHCKTNSKRIKHH